MTTITFEIFGSPAPKGSARAVMARNKSRAILLASGSKENEERQSNWRTDVRDAARKAADLILRVGPFMNTPLSVTIVFHLKRPADHWSKRGGLKPWAVTAQPHFKPDIDKLARATLDAMTGIIFTDDALVCSLIVGKAYASPDPEGATIIVCSLEGP